MNHARRLTVGLAAIAILAALAAAYITGNDWLNALAALIAVALLGALVARRR